MSGVLTPANLTNLDPQVWEPSDQNLVEANFDPIGAPSTGITTAGTLYLFRVVTRRPVTLTNAELFITTVGAGASTGSFVGVYDVNGNLLTGSADTGASLAVANRNSTPYTTAQKLIPGQITYRALLTNLATTQPTFMAGAGNSTPRANLGVNTPSAALRFSTNGSGLVALPASFVPAANAQAGSLALWFGSS